MARPEGEFLAAGREVRRVTLAGAVINVALSAFKITAGTIGSSQVVVADGVHSLSDLSTDFALLIGLQYWSAPADESHPYGHRRIETLVTAFIGVVLAFVALGLGYNALVTLRVRHVGPPGLIALIAALASIIVKESLYHWTMGVGKRTKSKAAIANAWHQRSDALSSIPAVLAVAGARYSPGWYFLDHIGALLVCAFILRAAWRIGWDAVQELADMGAGPKIHGRIESICLATEGVLGVHKCRTRRLGFGLQVDIHVQVKPELTVREGHGIAGLVKEALLEKGPDVADALIHLEPYEGEGPKPPDRS
ncbi:MAG: cation diffusion facilitator family transporter [Elusimicrobiota bacterium]